METTRAKTEWEKHYLAKVEANNYCWPNETMLRILFGSYLVHRISIEPGARVLDIGCGLGHNLLPFLGRGCEGYGVEVTEGTARMAQCALSDRGYTVQIEAGDNRNLPFPNGFFDLALSINVLHYENSEQNLHRALSEYARVLKPGGALFVITVGPEHEIYQKAGIVAPHLFRIRDYDFRTGECYFYFNNEKYLEHYLSSVFELVEVGRVTERLMTRKLDFLIATCQQKLTVG